MRWWVPGCALVVLYVATTIPFFLDVREIPRSNACGMTFSAPIYKTLTFQTQEASMHHTYVKYTLARLFLKDDTAHRRKRQDDRQLTGAPLLFVPGHLGSYKQARSLGQHLHELDTATYDIFLVDFNEEATGITGRFVLDQGFFLNEAIKEILAMYTRQDAGDDTLPRPTSLVVVGHSMGGLVARTALTLPNYQPHSITTIVTLSTPHVAPPFNLDSTMADVYATVNKHRGVSINASDDAVVLVSLAGGFKDFVVHSSLAALSPSTTSTWSFSALTSQLPKVKISMDHLSILWCHQFMRTLSKALAALVDPDLHQVIPSASKRAAVLQSELLGPDSDPSEHYRHVAVGYAPSEVADHSVKSFPLPLYIFRTQYLMPFPLLALVALAMLITEIEAWQDNDKLAQLSFLRLLSPIGHWSALYHHASDHFKDALWKPVAVLVVALGAMHAADATYPAWIVLLCYLYLLGFLHLVAFVLSWIRLPLSFSRSVARFGFSMKSYAAIAIIVVAGAHGAWRFNVDPTRELALLVLAALAVHVYVVLSLFVLPTKSSALYHRTLFAFYFGVSSCWIGDIVYFVDVVRFPRVLDFSFVLHVFSVLLLLAPGLAHVAIARRYGLPHPPAAFFARLQGVRMPTNSSTLVSPGDCTECFVEDGGVGAIFVQAETPATKHMRGGVTLGPTFRVVACDCGLRNIPHREYCAFCRRTCSSCGGGEVARQQANQFREYMNGAQETVMAHQGVPGLLWLILIVGFTFVATAPHALIYVAAVVGAVCALYHVGLRSPIDVEAFDGAVVRTSKTVEQPMMEEVSAKS
ncbi:hypothetical protein LEN26_007905 [Aphanomyces euteiches]|nr:hypothetical protein AeMF1_002716 [Aphanomyces euteiches]KAH9131101.1 hypothetical protein LEN26_007905 [Aphanomyces euteiches]KAH9195764.1 hypothetical protein AeNC1_002270 [Aphanomyces euteiches]